MKLLLYKSGEMIQAHLIATKPVTPIFNLPGSGSSHACTVDKGSWLGVLERKEEWIHVVGTSCEGWVRKEDVQDLPPMQLHIVYSPGKPIEYVCVA